MRSARSGSARIAARTNLMLIVCIVAVHAAALIVLPASMVLWIVAAIAAFGSPTHWALIHEAIHGVLLPNRAANDVAARLLAILFGVPFRAVRFAHLRHHRYNRTPSGREEVYDPTTQRRWLAYIQHYLRITFGLYAGELMLSLACWLPRSLLRPRLRALCPDLPDGTRGMASLVDRELLAPRALWEIRFDAIAIVALYGSAFALYGARWPIVAALLLVRGFLASQFDHAPHHDTPLDRRDYALNMRAPAWLGAMLLNFNLHRTHHQHPHLPWRALLDATRFEPGDISFVRAVLRQWRGPVALRDVDGSAVDR